MPKIAAIQISASDDITANLQNVGWLVEQAKSQDAQLVVLPECFAYMQRSREQLLQSAEVFGEGRIQQFIRALSRKLNIWIIAGSLPLRTLQNGKVSNTLLAYNNEGQCIARYDKIFLFDVSLPNGERYFESEYTVAGNDIHTIQTPVGKIGLSICYDLRFPELYRELVKQGAEILIAPSAFSATTGQHHWQPLLQARAIENSCYVIAPAQTGVHNDRRKTWGHTVIIDPWGSVLEELKDGCGVICCDVDLEKLYEIRQQLPSLQHCRTDLF